MNKNKLEYYLFLNKKYENCILFSKIAFSLFAFFIFLMAISGIFKLGDFYIFSSCFFAVLSLLLLPLIDKLHYNLKNKYGYFHILTNKNNAVVKCYDKYSLLQETRYFEEGVLHNEKDKAIKAGEFNLDIVEGYFYKGKEIKVNSLEQFKNFIKVNDITNNF